METGITDKPNSAEPNESQLDKEVEKIMKGRFCISQTDLDNYKTTATVLVSFPSMDDKEIPLNFYQKNGLKLIMERLQDLLHFGFKGIHRQFMIPSKTLPSFMKKI